MWSHHDDDTVWSNTSPQNASNHDSTWSNTSPQSEQNHNMTRSNISLRSNQHDDDSDVTFSRPCACCCCAIVLFFALIFFLAGILIMMNGETVVGFITLVPSIFCSLMAVCLCTLALVSGRQRPIPQDHNRDHIFTVQHSYACTPEVPPSYDTAMSDPNYAKPPSYESLVASVISSEQHIVSVPAERVMSTDVSTSPPPPPLPHLTITEIRSTLSGIPHSTVTATANSTHHSGSAESYECAKENESPPGGLALAVMEHEAGVTVTSNLTNINGDQ